MVLIVGTRCFMTAKKPGPALIAAGISAGLVLAGCTAADPEGGGPRGEVVFAEVVPFPDNLFPIIGAGESQSAANILVRILPSAFRILPDFSVAHDPELLTEAPTLDEVAGKQVNVYTINPDAVWSDGEPITVDDFAFTAKVQDAEFVEACPDGGVLGTFGYDQIESIEGSDDGKTVTVTYSTPYADWQALFTLLPAHLLDSEDDAELCATVTAGWPTGQGLPDDISGGPWRLEAKNIDVPGQLVTLTPNENYWGRQPHLAALTHQIIGAAPNAAFSGLENGEVQYVAAPPVLDLVQQVAGLAPNVNSDIVFGLRFEHLDFNTRNPHLADVNVRRAFGLALDRQEIVDQTVAQFSEDAQVLNNRIWFNTQPQYQDAAPEEYNSPDVVAGRALLEESGYALGADGVYAHPERGRLSLAISTLWNDRPRLDIINVIIPQAAKVGFEVVARPDEDLFNDASFATSLEAGGYDIALFAWIGGPFQSGSAGIYRSLEAQGGMQGQNYTHGGNPEVDALYEEFLREPDPDARAELGNRIDALLWEDLYTIPLYQQPTLFAYSADLRGVEGNASHSGPLWNSETWTLTQP